MSTPLEQAEIDRFVAWLDERRIGSGPVAQITSLSGGSQNSLISFDRGGRRLVIRRPPRDDKIGRRTVEREAYVLTALDRSCVPHPGLVESCADSSVLGTPFLLMSAVDGVNLIADAREPYLSNGIVQRRMSESIVAALVALARLDIDRGPPLVPVSGTEWPMRELARWRRRLETYGQRTGHRDVDLPWARVVADWLAKHCPTEASIGLTHGDVHIGNMLFNDAGELAALVDWELSSLGDPLLDLGQLLAWWPDSQRRHPSLVLAGLPPRDHVAEEYLKLARRDGRHLPWYQVLACYRLAVLLEGTHARSLASTAPQELGQRFHDLAQQLIDQALEVATVKGGAQ